MITSISVKSLKTIKHITNKYAVLLMYFTKINDFDTLAKTVIIKEIYLIKDLKTNLLIENNVLSFENIDIFNFTKSIHINSCDVIITITIRSKFKSYKLIHAFKAFTVFGNAECLMSIHHMIFFSNRDFFLNQSKQNFSYMCM